MKIWQIIKTVLYVSFAVVVSVFATRIIGHEDEPVGYANYFIGALMIVYGLESVILHFALKKSFESDGRFFWGLIEIMLGIILIVTVKDTQAVYIVWAVWSMFREARELRKTMELFKENKWAILNIIKPLVIIVFSVMLLVTPVHHHALMHVYLVAAELIADVVFSVIFWFLRDKKIQQIEENGNQTDK